MSVRLDHGQFLWGHELFIRHMECESEGVPFTSWQHPHLVADELGYKEEAYGAARHSLSLENWAEWRTVPGKILCESTEKRVCWHGSILCQSYANLEVKQTVTHVIVTQYIAMSGELFREPGVAMAQTRPRGPFFQWSRITL